MRVLVACEYSGRVRDAFIRAGHDAISCDLLPSETPGPHYQGDVKDILNGMEVEDSYLGGVPFCELSEHDKERVNQDILTNDIAEWDLLIAHPPCTYLSVSGMHWTRRGLRDPQLTEDALEFVQILMDAPIEKICIENPVSIISSRIRKPEQIIQPWMFGDDASKKTCLWLKNLPPLQPTKIIYPRVVGGKKRWANQTDSGQNKLAPSEDRWKIRSATYPGIAQAMADQWGAI